MLLFATIGLLTTIFKHGDNAVFTNLRCLLLFNDCVFVKLYILFCFRLADEILFVAISRLIFELCFFITYFLEWRSSSNTEEL